ncbi:hypothetical protein AAY473_002373 [Plecturocebus cupreus]
MYCMIIKKIYAAKEQTSWLHVVAHACNPSTLGGQDRVLLCHPGWSAMAQSCLSAISTSQVQTILLSCLSLLSSWDYRRLLEFKVYIVVGEQRRPKVSFAKIVSNFSLTSAVCDNASNPRKILLNFKCVVLLCNSKIPTERKERKEKRKGKEGRKRKRKRKKEKERPEEETPRNQRKWTSFCFPASLPHWDEGICKHIPNMEEGKLKTLPSAEHMGCKTGSSILQDHRVEQRWRSVLRIERGFHLLVRDLQAGLKLLNSGDPPASVSQKPDGVTKGTGADEEAQGAEAQGWA